MSKEYIEMRQGGYYIVGTRISLDSIVYAFLDGASPESILQSFPLLTLEQVYGAITFYLANRVEVDAYLKQQEADFEVKRQASRDANPELYKKLEEAKKRLQTTRS
jgi:uncharacterized protein (DUF433 family)